MNYATIIGIILLIAVFLFLVLSTFLERMTFRSLFPLLLCLIGLNALADPTNFTVSSVTVVVPPQSQLTNFWDFRNSAIRSTNLLYRVTDVNGGPHASTYFGALYSTTSPLPNRNHWMEYLPRGSYPVPSNYQMPVTVNSNLVWFVSANQHKNKTVTVVISLTGSFTQ